MRDIIISIWVEYLKSSNMKRVALSLAFVVICAIIDAQVPQGFNYQAIARDGDGNLITDAFDIKVEIQNLAADTVFWIEEHNVTPNEYGLISFVVGQSGWTGGTETNFSDIDWVSRPRYLKTSADQGSGYTVMGTTQIWAVPYSLVAKDVTGPIRKLDIAGTTEEMDEALFEVRNKDGQTIFAVYNQGVRIYVDDVGKGPKGGFAIGGFGTVKGTSQPYFIVKPDTVRIYINQSGKGVKGGFAIGGYGIDKADPQNFLFVSDDSVRVYVDNADDDTPKGVKGGFAIGGYGITKGDQKFLTVSDDSVRIYINDTNEGKSVKGGFAIGGFGTTKGESKKFMNIDIDTTGKIDPSENRILWYPLKNAFRTGKVLIEKKDSVGENSFASGFESKAIGDWSQALGYKAIARGDYSTAIGKNAVANNINSFAFGDSARATNAEGYAIGRGAVASGYRSFAFGSAGVDIYGSPIPVTRALGAYSFAIGQGSLATYQGSYAIGIADTSSGYASLATGFKTKASHGYSTAMGYNTQAIEWFTTALGAQTIANGMYSTALGWLTNASGFTSSAIGWRTIASGSGSIAIGYYTTASGSSSTAMGSNTTASGGGATAMGSVTIASGLSSTAMGDHSTSSGSESTSMGFYSIAPSAYETAIGSFNTNYTPISATDWNPNDRLFVIGNGINGAERSDALIIYKSGNAYIQGSLGIGTTDPDQKLVVYNGSTTGKYTTAGWTHTSDIRLKENIVPVSNVLSDVLKLQGVRFSFISDNTKTRQIGFIAQDFEKVFPEFVVSDNDGYKSISYGQISAVLVEAIKEQQQQIESYKSENDNLKSQLQSLQEEVDQIKAFLATSGGE
jgi:hypothetical protein